MFSSLRYRQLILIVGFLTVFFSPPTLATYLLYGTGPVTEQLVSKSKDTCLTYLTPLYDKIPYDAQNACAPIRIHLINNGTQNITRTISFKIDWLSDNSYQYVFHLKPGESAQKIAYIPVRGSQIDYSIDDETNFTANLTESAPTEYAYIGIHSPNGRNEWPLFSTSSYDTYATPFNLMEWPADYRVYAALDTLIIDRKEYETSLDEAHRKAIRQWVTSGGRLWLVGNENTVPSSVPLGMGLIVQMPSLKHLTDDKKEERLKEILKDSRVFPTPPPASTENYNLCASKLRPDDIAHQPFLITSPSALVGMILLPFAIIVGPLCLWYWAPVGKRQRLFFLIPAISVIFFILIALCILLDDGMGGKGERNTLILVNQEDHSALIMQNQICRTAVITRSGFSLPEEVVLQGKSLEHSDGDRSYYALHGSNTYTQNLKRTIRRGDECSGGWFTSRSTLVHYLTRAVTTRAAINVNTASAPALHSSYPATLNRLIYRDNNGKLWHLPTLNTGEQQAAQPGLPADLPPTMANHVPTLPNNAYLAEMQSTAPDLNAIPTLPSIDWEKTHITVIGIINTPTLP